MTVSLSATPTHLTVRRPPAARIAAQSVFAMRIRASRKPSRPAPLRPPERSHATARACLCGLRSGSRPPILILARRLGRWEMAATSGGRCASVTRLIDAVPPRSRPEWTTPPGARSAGIRFGGASVPDLELHNNGLRGLPLRGWLDDPCAAAATGAIPARCLVLPRQWRAAMPQSDQDSWARVQSLGTFGW